LLIQRGGFVRHSKIGAPMSVWGQKQTFRYGSVMSASPPKADIAGRDLDVRFVPMGDIGLRR